MRKLLKKFILHLIEKIEEYEYRNLELDEDDISKKIIDTVDISDQGLHVLSHDGYHPATHIHKTQPYTIYELELESGDRLECADNHIVFCSGFEQKFVKDLTTDDYVMTKSGLVRVRSILRTDHKVSMYDLTIDSEDHSYYTNNILSHNTVIAAIFLLHTILFNADRNVGIAANIYSTATEIINKIKEILDHIPYFLKPGILVNNIDTMTFDNGCRIIGQATTKRSFIGYTIHTLYLDEFAHVDKNVLDEFYENIIPTVSSMQDSKVIITSTPNGYNRFYDIYQGAVDKLNPYNPIRVDWWQVPGRDDAWAKSMIETIGEDEFGRQYGNSFLTSANTLLTPDVLSKIQQKRTTFTYQPIRELENYYDAEWDNLMWDPSFNIESLSDVTNKFVIGCDLSEGGGGDYSVMQIFQLVPRVYDDSDEVKIDKKTQAFKMVQVGVFHSNTIAIDVYAKLLYLLTHHVMNSDNCRVVVEYNTYGGEMIRCLNMVMGDKNEFDPSIIVKYRHSQDNPKKKMGLRLNGYNKTLLCMSFRNYCTSGNVEVIEDLTVGEFEIFSRTESGSYRAQGSSRNSHDDLCMASIDACSFLETPDCENFIDELLVTNSSINKKLRIDVDEPKVLMPNQLQHDLTPRWMM